MSDIPSHHLIYGTLIDFINGETLTDTDDERFRQRIARFLVEEKGWAKDEIRPRVKIETLFSGNFVVSKIDFVVMLEERGFMVVRYGPGSMVTREKPALAAARVLEPDYIIPVAVVTNGRDAEVLETRKGRVMATGLEGIVAREDAPEVAARLGYHKLPDARREAELRILNAYDVEVCCAGGPCPLPGAREG